MDSSRESVYVCKCVCACGCGFVERVSKCLLMHNRRTAPTMDEGRHTRTATSFWALSLCWSSCMGVCKRERCLVYRYVGHGD